MIRYREGMSEAEYQQTMREVNELDQAYSDSGDIWDNDEESQYYDELNRGYNRDR
jgi:hypothetical protein